MSFSKTAKATAKVTEAYNVFPVKHLKDNNTANFEREWGENFFRQKKFSPLMGCREVLEEQSLSTFRGRNQYLFLRIFLMTHTAAAANPTVSAKVPAAFLINGTL